MDISAIERRIKIWEDASYKAKKSPCSIRKLREVREVVSLMGTLANALGDEIEKTTDEMKVVILVGLNGKLGELFKVYEMIVKDIEAELSKPQTYGR